MNSRTHRTILESVQRLKRRWLTTRSFRYSLQALFYLLLACALVLLAFPSLSMGTLAGVLVVAAVLCGGVAALAQCPDEAALAKDYDDTAGLKDRISSSIELAGRTGPMVEALMEDAAISTARVAPAQVYRYSMPREGRWLPVPALLVAGVLLLNTRLDANQHRDLALEERLAAGASVLEDMISEQKQQELTEKQKEILEQLEQLKAQLSDRDIDKKEAMAEVAQLLDQLEREQEAEKDREQKLREMLEGLKEKNEELADELQEGNWEEALNKLKKEIEELQKKLAEKKKNGATPEELAELEQKLKELKEINAKLMQLMQVRSDLKMLGMTIEFLEFFEGDLGDLSDQEPPDFLKPCDCKDHGT